jgi:hypothetical protein
MQEQRKVLSVLVCTHQRWGTKEKQIKIKAIIKMTTKTKTKKDSKLILELLQALTSKASILFI